MPKPPSVTVEEDLLRRLQLGEALRRQGDPRRRLLALGSAGRRPPSSSVAAPPASRSGLQIGRTLGRRGLDMAQHGQADHLVALHQPDAAHAGAVAPGEHPQHVVGHLEADAAALARWPAARRRPRGRSRRRSAGRPRRASWRSGRRRGHCRSRTAVAPDVARRGGEDEMQALPQALILRQRQHGGDRVAAAAPAAG